MGEKQCGTCGEMVDAAKAFCPGCGNAFVEEKTRTSVSDFDLSGNTVKLGDTMYNQMLSDMGLSISKAPNRDEKRVETIAPAVGAPPAASTERRVQPEPPPAPPASRRGLIIGLVVIAIALAILAALIVVAAAMLYFRYPSFLFT